MSENIISTHLTFTQAMVLGLRMDLTSLHYMQAINYDPTVASEHLLKVAASQGYNAVICIRTHEVKDGWMADGTAVRFIDGKDAHGNPL